MVQGSLLDLISHLLFTGCWFCVDAELKIGQCRLGVHGTCGLHNLWNQTCGRCHSWVETLVDLRMRPLMGQQNETKIEDSIILKR